jgi:uncharacterized protein YxjI
MGTAGLVACPRSRPAMSDPFGLDSYLVRRKVFKLLGAGFQVYDDSGRVVAYSAQKAFKLREDIRVFADERETRPLMRIQARQVIDFSACYDVVDERDHALVGSARRKGLKSLLRDNWELLDAEGRTVATLEEDSMAMALLRRFVGHLIPQNFHLGEGSSAVEMSQHFNPFVYRLQVTIPKSCQLDRRLIFGLVVLVAAIEGRQN